MNKQDAKNARTILTALRPLSDERQLVVVRALMAPLGETITSGFSTEEYKIWNTILDETDDTPWRSDNDVFAEVLEAIETDCVGTCDACSSYTALKSADSTAGEGVFCKWGCPEPL